MLWQVNASERWLDTEILLGESVLINKVCWPVAQMIELLVFGMLQQDNVLERWLVIQLRFGASVSIVRVSWPVVLVITQSNSRML